MVGNCTCVRRKIQGATNASRPSFNQTNPIVCTRFSFGKNYKWNTIVPPGDTVRSRCNARGGPPLHTKAPGVASAGEPDRYIHIFESLPFCYLNKIKIFGVLVLTLCHVSIPLWYYLFPIGAGFFMARTAGHVESVKFFNNVQFETGAHVFAPFLLGGFRAAIIYRFSIKNFDEKFKFSTNFSTAICWKVNKTG